MMKRQIGQIGGVRQQVALLDMLDMSWYNGCPFGGTRGRHGPAQKLPYYDGVQKSPVYIKISLYDGHIKSPGICLYDRLQKCRGLYDSFKKSPGIF